MLKIRLDKWLWAARFFKTRVLAKSAIETGKIHVDGQKSKPSRMIEIGELIKVRQGDDERIITVVALSEQRRGAPEAQSLYKETQESISKREKKSAERKAFYGSTPASVRPNKKQRRQIHRFLEN
ncbi:MAG: S4 domain-containing protein [Porticoccaceae bacterium]|jgi:ribosome-associated heat shock protein Hsp15|nr:S4 domain-containing protein [Porticoccaceae bacterium]